MSKSKSISLKDFESKLIKDLKDPFKQNKAFEILLDKYKEKVYFQIRRIVLNHDDTDDILQNVFIKVFRGIKGFKGESKLSTWIYRIAYNESINFLKLKEKKYFYSSEIMMNTMVNNLREDPYFDGDEVELKLHEILNISNEKIQSIGLSFRKVEYMKNVLIFFRDNKININEMSNDEITKSLISIKGIGKWTCEMFLMFVCLRKDIFSFGDLALINSMKKNYCIDDLNLLKSISEKWKPYRTIAALLLWYSIENNIYFQPNSSL